MLGSLWQTLLLNLVINGANPRIDHWCAAECWPVAGLGRHELAASEHVCRLCVVHISQPPGLSEPVQGLQKGHKVNPNSPMSRLHPCRGHGGGLLGGALAALLLGPRWKQTTLPKARGRWLVDTAPVPWLRSSPKPLDGGRGRLR